MDEEQKYAIGNVKQHSIETEMEKSYLEYSMSVIVMRACRTSGTGSNRFTGAYSSVWAKTT